MKTLRTFALGAVRPLALLMLPLFACSCQPKDRTFLTINVCLGDPENVAKFKEQMRSIAHAEQMEFIDGSAATNTELSGVNAGHAAPQPFVNVGIKDGQGVIVIGGNLGLTNRQVALGFREGVAIQKDHAFADRTISILKQNWRVETVAPDKGAIPMKGC